MIKLKINDLSKKRFLLNNLKKNSFSFMNESNNSRPGETKSNDNISLVQKIYHFRSSIFTSIFTIGLATNGKI
jgi:hypothetical protein